MCIGIILEDVQSKIAGATHLYDSSVSMKIQGFLAA